jgi:hypothetical protein
MWETINQKQVTKVIVELLRYSSDKSLTYTPKVQLLLQELIALTNKNLKYGLIIKSLINLKKENKKDLDSFKLIYASILEEYKIEEQNEWDVLLPYENDMLRRKFKVLGQEFSIVSLNTFKRLVPEILLMKQVNNTYEYRVNKFILPKHFIKIKMKGFNLRTCWDTIRTQFTILQGVYDFGMLKGLWIQGDGAMTSFKHPEWIVLHDKKARIEFGIFRLYGTRIRTSTNIIRLKEVKNTLQYISKEAEPNSAKSLIFDCFRLYAQAMESVHNHNCFLSLWQLIENVCVSESAKTTDVINRINVIVQETKIFDFEIGGLYKLISKKRNDLVHKGIDFTNNDDSNLLKILAETTIEWLMEKEKILKTKTHVNEYFKLRTRNDKDKKAIRETMRYIERHKKK